MEQAVAEKKLRNEHVYCSDSLSIRHCKELATKKCSTNAAIPSLSYLVHQFAPLHPRRDSSKYFTCKLPVIKKMQAKTKQNDNPDIHYVNCNASNVRKGLVNNFDRNHTIILSSDDKYIVNIEVPGCPLELCPMTYEGWTAEVVKVIAAYYDTVMQSNLVPAITFDIDICPKILTK